MARYSALQHAAEPPHCLQVLCCEVDGIFDTLVNSADLLAELFSFLGQDPLDKSRAAYFLRVIVSLLTKCSAPVMDYVAGVCCLFGSHHCCAYECSQGLAEIVAHIYSNLTLIHVERSGPETCGSCVLLCSHHNCIHGCSQGVAEMLRTYT